MIINNDNKHINCIIFYPHHKSIINLFFIHFLGSDLLQQRLAAPVCRAAHHLYYRYGHQFYGHKFAPGLQNETVVLYLNHQRYGTGQKRVHTAGPCTAIYSKCQCLFQVGFVLSLASASLFLVVSVRFLSLCFQNFGHADSVARPS